MGEESDTGDGRDRGGQHHGASSTVAADSTVYVESGPNKPAWGCRYAGNRTNATEHSDAYLLIA